VIRGRWSRVLAKGQQILIGIDIKVFICFIHVYIIFSSVVLFVCAYILNLHIFDKWASKFFLHSWWSAQLKWLVGAGLIYYSILLFCCVIIVIIFSHNRPFAIQKEVNQRNLYLLFIECVLFFYKFFYFYH